MADAEMIKENAFDQAVKEKGLFKENAKVKISYREIASKFKGKNEIYR